MLVRRAAFLVANNQFRLEFFQKEPVGGKVAPTEYDLYMADKSGAAVSEVRKFVADKTSPERADRIVRVTFAMLADAKTSAKETYYLTHGGRTRAREPWPGAGSSAWTSRLPTSSKSPPMSKTPEVRS